MSNDVASRARWSINSAIVGTKQLRKVKTYKVTDNRDAEHVFGTDGEDPAGVVDKPGGAEIEFEYFVEQGNPEVSWRKLQEAKEYFTLTREYVGGERVQFSRCRVANAGGDGDNEGSHMISVKIISNSPKVL